MSIIDNFRIEGLWGDDNKNIEFKCCEDVNFLIGVNGSGKTTVINILAACLLADYQALKKLPFKKVSIVLKKDNKKPSIEVCRIDNDENIYDDFLYKIKQSSRSKVREYNLGEGFFTWSREHYFMRASNRHKVIQRKIDKEDDNIKIVLGELIEVSWLSVHRTSFNERKESNENKSPVDLKLGEMLIELGKYFSTLDKLSFQEQNNFQENVFLALLHDKNSEAFKNILKKQNEDALIEEQNHLLDIFKKFEISSTNAKKKVNAHFSAVKEANKVLKEGAGIEWKYLMPLVLNSRIDVIIDEWSKFNKRKDEIFEPLTKFLTVLNSLFQRKKIGIDNRNQLQIETQSGKLLDYSELSSGEKQLLIVLIQAVLQRNEQWVYIADEPELSLHVKWQDQLVNNIRFLNPNAQIVFATHSPDIVGEYSSNVHDMEKVL